MDDLEVTDTLDAGAAAASTDEQQPTTADSALIEDELLVEEISIDGMCGVY